MANENEEFVTVKYHKKVARWTQLLTIVTFFLALATAIGGYISIEDTRSTFFASRRPVISFERDNAFQFGWHWRGSPTNIDGYNFSYVLQNTGETSATGVRMVTETYETPASGPHSDINDPPIPKYDEESTVIGAKSTYQYVTYIPISTLLDVYNGKKRLFILMRIEYRDVFSTGTTYHFNNCEEVEVSANEETLRHPTANSDLGDFFELINCGRYNDAD